MGFREKIILFGIVPWILVILISVFGVVPIMQGLFEKNTVLAEKEAELAGVKLRLKAQKNVKALKEKIGALNYDLIGFNKEFPENDELETFYVDFQKALNESNISLAKINISTEKSVKFPKEYFEGLAADDKKKPTKESKKKKRAKKAQDPVVVKQRNFKINIIGEYENILDLLYYLQSYYRLINLEYISVKPARQKKDADLSKYGEKPVDVTFTFNVYKFNKNIIVEETDTKKKSPKEEPEELK